MQDLASLCMGCMETKREAGVCPRCGWRETTAAESPLHLRPRTELHGQYLVGRVLGHGGFGITYLGWDISLERRVAIKEYLPNGVAVRTGVNSEVIPFSGDMRKDFEWGLERYLDEGRVVARFHNHSTIISVWNFFRENGTAYLVMEYLEGVTFEKYLEMQGGRTGVDTVLTVMTPVLDALAAVHKAGILHRDISPDNIYITRNWQVKVLDFGAARYAMGQRSRNLSVILKEGYAPMEQYHSKGQQGAWTDVYACGATIYRALTGKVPPASLDRLQGEPLPAPSELGVAIEPWQEAVLAKALSVRHEERFQSMEEFRGALVALPEPGPVAGREDLQKTVPVRVPAPPPQTPGPRIETGPLPGPEGRQPPVEDRHPKKTPSLPVWVWAAAAGVVFALVAVGGWKQYEAAEQRKEAERQREIAEVRKREEQKRLEVERQREAEREQARRRELALLEQQEDQLRRQQEQLREKDAEIERERRRNQQQQQQPFVPVRQRQQQQQQQQQSNPYNALAENLRRQQQQQQQQQRYQQQPARLTYEALLQSGDRSIAARNPQAALNYYLQAIRMDSNNPQAYASAGWVYLHYMGDLGAAAGNYRRAYELGGSVWFKVFHDHSNMTFQNRCVGALGLSKARIQYRDDRGAHNFSLPRDEVAEFRSNRNPFNAVRGDFHVKSRDGRNYNLVAVKNGEAVEELILQFSAMR